MSNRSELAGRPLRRPTPPRSRKRRAVAGGIAGLWIILLACTRSIIGGTALVVLIAALVIGSLLALRYLGIDRDHPWVQRAATRPWRDGREVLQLALRHMPEVFVITPSGSLLAPNAVELRMNPADVASLTEMMELEVINSSASELYETTVAAHAASLASAGPVEVSIVADPAVPVGRYRLRQGRRAGSADGDGDAAGNAAAPRRDERAHVGQSSAPTLVRDVLTVQAPSWTPLLRLRTKDCVAETRVSGARAGRGIEVDLPLPDEPTVSRVHAEFTFTEGEWRITSLGRNGVLVNETRVVDEQALHDGDLIRWGPHPDALVSRVEVG
jgi:FHA domain